MAKLKLTYATLIGKKDDLNVIAFFDSIFLINKVTKLITMASVY